MNDLHQLLDLAAGGGTGARADDDLARARVARTRQRRHRYSAGLAALGVVAVAGVGGTIALDRRADETPPAVAPAAPAVRLVAERLDAAPYTFDLSPQGWSVQAVTPYAVTIVPDDGSTAESPDDFRGKLVILFDANPLDGEQVVSGGRTFWVSGDSGYTQMATPTLPGEPSGVVRIQFPDATGWTRDTMLRFLGSVHVGDTAEQGVG